MQQKKAYMNPMQYEAAVLNTRDQVIVAGRGTGKGRLQALRILNNVQAMPGSTGAMVAPNAIRCLTNILPSITAHWEEWGYRRGIHYDVGRRPPKALNWPKPLFEPYSYDNVVSFYTGAIMLIVSQDRKGTSNSKSFDWIIIDEAKFIKYEQLKDETFQANRGQQREFGHCHLHHGVTITSDMPITKAGSWFLRYEEEMNKEDISLILGLLTQRQAVQLRIDEEPHSPTNQRRGYQLAEIDRLLASVRKRSLFFKTYSTLTNIEVLGEAYIRQMKRDLPPLIFYTSILCRRIRQLKDGFYSSMRDHHLYTAANFAYLDAQDYNFSKLKKKTAQIDADIQPDRPLCIAFDFNRNINWLVVGQPDEEQQRMNTLKAFWVKYKRKLAELVQDFCDYYASLPAKRVVFYYDATAVGNNYAVNDIDFHRVVEQVLRRNGWTVTPKYIGAPMNHGEKHLLINQGFAGQRRLTPFFNEENCADLLVSIQTAGVYNGKKDKRGEKLAETGEDPLEARTDGSDAWDTLYIGCERFPQNSLILPVTSNW